MENLKIRFGLSFWIFLAVATLLKHGYFATVYFTAVLLHELAHYAVARARFYHCYEVRVSVFGAVLYGDFRDVEPHDRIAIALAGPLANAVMCVLCLALWWAFPSTYVFTEVFFAANASMACVNMLPCYPLDGGRVVTGLLEKYTQKALKIVKASSIVVASVCFGLFVVSLFTGSNWFGVGIFALCLASGLYDDGGGECYVKLSFADTLRRCGTEKKTLVFAQTSTLSDVAKRIKGNYLYCLDVVDEELNVVAHYGYSALERLVVELPSDTLLRDVGRVGNGGTNVPARADKPRRPG